MASDSTQLQVLVVDDSAYNRQTISAMLETVPNVEVVGRAVNGKEALRLAFDLLPDLVTLDLEMPEMDGFAFLRLLMSKRPTPVLVISGYAGRENVFRALELGALDFVAKPSREVSPDLRAIEGDLVQKIHVVRKLHAVRLRDRARNLASIVSAARPGQSDPVPFPGGAAPACMVAIGASTGGPPAVQQLLCALPDRLPVAIMVAQHMPARFTRAFAERLDRFVTFTVVEAEDGQPVCAGTVYVAPGSSNLEVERDPRGRLRVKVVAVDREMGVPVITPSADHLFKSLAFEYRSKLCAVVLTGMGSDGRDGARTVKSCGGHVVAEDPLTAVMPGMPHSAIEAGVVDEVVSLEALSAAIERFWRGHESSA